MVTVMGATGHIGRQVVVRLLEMGESVRGLGRSEGKLAELERAGAEPLAGDGADVAFLARAFDGADAVHTLLPYDVQAPDYHACQDRQGEAIVKALRETGVRHVVFVSSVGADQPRGTGPIASLHAQEERLRQLDGTNVFILRPGSFFENFYGSLELIRQEGWSGDAVRPDLPIPMIATRDVAEAAAQALATRKWNGVVVRELLGPRDLSYAEATAILGARIGKPGLEYVQLPYDDLAAALVQSGFSRDVAGLYADLARGINEGRVRSLEGRTSENTTPTRFEAFAEELARAYRAPRAAA